MATLDTFELTDAGVMIVNGRPLIEIVREIELPYAKKELDDRIAEGEDPNELYLLAGDYIYPSVRLPDRNLLDEPALLAERGFTDISDTDRGKALILECTCGIPDCWFLTARIALCPSTVRWHDFSQFHRDWIYPLDFTFDREEYERQLQPRGEQAGARQAATAAESKSEENDKPKPESKRRSP